MSEQINPEVVADNPSPEAVPLSESPAEPATIPAPEEKSHEPQTTVLDVPTNEVSENGTNAAPVQQSGNVEPLPPVPSNESPRTGRGRHPKGCKCGNCIQSGGTGGYEKGGRKRPSTLKPNSAKPPEDKPDFSDVLGSQSKPNIVENTVLAQSSGTDFAALASVTFDMSTGVLTTIFGPEWQPRSPEEKQLVCGPLAVYMKSRDMKDLPPGAILAFVCTAYAAPRLQAPSTKQKLSMWFVWLKSKFIRKRI